jgi:glutamate synthase (NADPH/NADH) small chain
MRATARRLRRGAAGHRPASEGRQTRIPNSDHEKVFRAVDLLRQDYRRRSLRAAALAVVIGGGNVAMDIARSLARLQKQQYGRVDVVLTALEDNSTSWPTRRKSRKPCEEGVIIRDQCGPQGCRSTPTAS